jgi:hypothetical protein
LKGLEAIAFYNGWSIAAAGVFIVFTALVTLAFVLSQLHKLILIWEKRDDYIKGTLRLFSRRKKSTAQPIVRVSKNINESARQFNLLIKSLKDPFFSLPRLILLAKKIGISRPHATVNELLKAKLVVPDNKGYYYWDHTVYKNILKKES